MSILEQVVDKHKSDRETIRALKAKHAEELRVIEELQKKREDYLLGNGDMTCFGYVTDLFVNGRDGKAAAKKTEESIAMDQTKLEAWLLKMLSGVGEGIKTEFGTVFKTRKESVTCADFEMFIDQNMLKPAAEKVAELFSDLGIADPEKTEQILRTIHDNMHLELLTKAVRKESVLELMGEPAKDGSRPNSPPAGANYVSIVSVGVRKAK